MKKIKTFLKEYGLISLIIGGPVLGLAFMIFLSAANPSTKQEVHWHMPINYDLCGDTTQLEDDGAHSVFPHGHNDNKIHVEGIIDHANRTETFGNYLSSTGIDITENSIGGFTNGDSCPGSETPGKLQVIINGIETPDFKNHILNDADTIDIIFK